MSLYDQINEELKTAMKAKDQQRLTALRGIRSAFILECKKNNADTLSDEACVDALRKLAKQRADSIDAYTQAGRADLADAERGELSVIEGFLPQLADEATTRAWVQAALAETGVTDPKQVGRVLGAVMKAHKGEVDGNLAKKIATQLLGG